MSRDAWDTVEPPEDFADRVLDALPDEGVGALLDALVERAARKLLG